MPNAQNQITLLDIAKANGSDPVVGLIDETTRSHPEVAVGAARTIKGQSYKTWVRTSLPTATFRNANQGVGMTKSVYENRVVETFIINPRTEVDKAVADKYEDGAAAYIGIEGLAQMESAIATLGRTFYYGRNLWQVNGTGPFAYTINGTAGTYYGGDPNGFPGLIDGFNSTYEYDAGGTTALTASSVWGVKWGPKNVQWVWGEEGQLELSDVMLQRLTDANGNPFTGYVQEVLAYPGLQIGDLRGVLRIKNITADGGHTLTDALIYDALSLIPAGIRPDVLFMSRRSLNQLRNSRTAVNITGQPAPIPTEVDGIPIKVTDSLSNVEPINFLSV